MIDLHVHSTFSDGSLTPEQLVERAVGMGLRALALTDHDGTGGLPRFVAAARGTPMTAVAGVEISVDVKRGTLHMLGYFMDPANEALEGNLRRIREGRVVRNQEILEKLRAMGMNLEWEEVRRLAGEEVVSRPHFAKAMMARGYVKDKEEAFEKYLAKGRPAYAERFRLSPEESIGMIAGAGGVAVLAHPFTLDLDRRGMRDYVAELKGWGLAGIECYYPEHGAIQCQEYLALARELDLAPSGGSDFHGESNPAVEMGVGFGSLRVPDELLDGLLARRKDAAGTA